MSTILVVKHFIRSKVLQCTLFKISMKSVHRLTWSDQKQDKDYPENQPHTQVNWRSTRHVGCADRAARMDDESYCHVECVHHAIGLYTFTST